MDHLHEIFWTVWGSDGPVRESATHVLNDADESRTLCGVTLAGKEVEGGRGDGVCKRCRAAAQKQGKV